MELDRLRRQLALGLLGLLWAFLPLDYVVGRFAGTAGATGVGIALLCAGACTPLGLRAPGATATRLALAVALIASVSVLVWLVPARLRIDLHMCYFAALAILAGFCDRRVILAGLLAVAADHLGLNFLLPSALFPAHADLLRVLLHAVIAAIEAGMLIWIVARIEAAVTQTHDAAGEAALARSASEAEADRRQAGEAAASVRRREGRVALAGRIESGLSQVAASIIAAGSELQGATGRIGTAAHAASVAAQAATEAVPVPPPMPPRSPAPPRIWPVPWARSGPRCSVAPPPPPARSPKYAPPMRRCRNWPAVRNGSTMWCV